MGLTEVVQEVEKCGGTKHFTLGELRDAYLTEHYGSGRTNLSEGLVALIRAELNDHGCLIWPEKMDNHRQNQNVYVISKAGKVGCVIWALGMEPNCVTAPALRNMLDEPSVPEAAQAS
jgi:hypothetical protein